MGTDEKGRGGKDAAALSGGHLCHVCGFQYPNPHPSAKLRRSHRKHCGKAAPAVAAEGNAALEGNTGEGTLLGLGGGAGGGRREEIAGAKSQANGGGDASCGSAGGAGASVEAKVIAGHASPTGTGAQAIATELSENNLIINCGNSESASPEDIGTQIITSELSENSLADCINSCIEIGNEGNGTESQITCIDEGQTKVAHPAEREDSFDDFQDASPFLHQSDFEDGAAPSSVFPTEINNLNTISSGSSVTANEISLETNGLCKDQLSGEPNMRNLSAEPQVGYNVEDRALRLVEPELTLKLGDPYDHSVDVDNTYTDMVNSKSDKTSGCCESINDSNASSLQETPPIILEPELGKVEGFVEDIMHVLHPMPEGSPRPVVGADNIRLERMANPITNAMPIGSDLKVVCTDNTPTDCSTRLPTQNLTVDDISDDHQHVDNSCKKSLDCSTAGFKYDLSVTNVDDIPFINVDDLEFTSDERPEVGPDASEENPSVRMTNGFTEEEVCYKHIDVEIPTEDQFSMSQKHATLLMDQASSVKNPFNLDDDRNDDLFELSADSCYLEVSNAVVESRQQVDTKSLLPTVSNQTRMAEVQQCHNLDEHILPASNASGNGEVVISPEDMPISSSSELVNKTCLTDHGLNEDEVHTAGIIFVPSQVASTELSMVSTQDTSALGEEVEETTQTEDATSKEMTAVRSIGGIEMKQAIDTAAKDTHAANIEDMKLTEGTAAGMNEVQHIDCVEAQMQAGSTKDVSAVQSIEHLEENKQTENADAKETNSWSNSNDVEDKTETTKEMIAAESTESVEEKQQPKGIVGQDGSNDKQNEEIDTPGSRLNSRRVRVPLKVLLAEASAENQVKKPSTKERVLSFGRRASKDGNSSATGSDDHHWSSPAKLPRKDVDKSSRGRKQPWMPFICCHSVH
ncbi:hypothetical protein U9M48_014816 [Paspalum notatum var. saurae]|uniref:Uncharacterized protein n=1 Tax=Paspalum notatum var. saurae TaxID=547442 RepID=A0AAQ3WKV7_PASNO